MSKCIHGKRKCRCVICDGVGICPHKKIKYYCVDCMGAGVCIHKKRKNICIECNGKSLCIHKKEKRYCVECSGSAMCFHGKHKRFCKECNSYLCIHNKEKRLCIICNTSLCIHEKQKKFCKLCKGSIICVHHKRKYDCIECHGSNYSTYCIHSKLKVYCKTCDGKLLCHSPFCETKGNKKYKGYCLFCFINLFPDEPVTMNYKTKEKEVADKIIEAFPKFTWVADKKVEDGCSKRRPDLLLDLGFQVIIVEIDENKHIGYDCSCENKRLMEISKDLQHRPVIFIRFNPDDYIDKDGKLIKSCWKLNYLGIMQIMKTKQKEWNERIDCLKNQIQYWIKNETNKTVEVVELFY